MTLRLNSSPSEKVTLLVLGAGWTWQFLHPLLKESNITRAATSTTGREGTIRFKFDGETTDLDQFKKLPTATYVLVTFPLRGSGLSSKLVKFYSETHPHSDSSTSKEGEEKHVPTKWILLGSTGIYTEPNWNDSSSPVDTDNQRCVAENELIDVGGCVLNLSGLYGGGRNPRNWVARVAQNKEALSKKGALHLIHGRDVARGVIALIKTDGPKSNDDAVDQSDRPVELFGRRWILTDCVIYDWWALIWDFMGVNHEHTPQSVIVENADAKTKYRQWLMELMNENNLHGLPRPVSQLGKKLDSRDFWKAVGILPERALAR